MTRRKFFELRKGDVVRLINEGTKRLEWSETAATIPAGSFLVVAEDRPSPSVRRDNVYFRNGLCVVSCPAITTKPCIVRICFLPEDCMGVKNVPGETVFPWGPDGKIPNCSNKDVGIDEFRRSRTYRVDLSQVLNIAFDAEVGNIG